MRPYRDRITIKQDARAAGSDVPAFTTTLATEVPCGIHETRGDETWRGVQLESVVDYVLELPYTSTLATVAATDQITITSGLWNGKTLNVSWPHIHQMKNGRPPMIEVFCRENNSG